jgi:hypothetical protein
MRLFKTLAIAGLLLAALAGGATAHTPYVKPLNFSPTGEWTSVQLAYSTQIFCPLVGIGPPENFQLLAPDGGRIEFSSAQVTLYETALELALPARGTYRLSTGEVLGPIERMVYERRRWRALRPNETPSRRARVTTMQMVMVAEAYITKGETTRAPLEPLIGTLAIRPITHPNEITVASGLELQLFFNGAPFPNMPFVLYAHGDSEDDMHRTFVTDSDGRARLTFEEPGMYLAVVRYRPSVEGAGVDVRSYSTTLAFDVRAAPGP